MIDARVMIVVLILGVVPAARASTSDCSDSGDGTPCATGCISSGSCNAGVCVPIVVRPDGSACTSGNRCTVNDTCQLGQCITGGTVQCPSIPPCKQGACVPQLGCILVNSCRPDLAEPADMSMPIDASMLPVDMSTPDLAMTLDAGPTDSGVVITDMCFMPPGSEFLICPGADGPVQVPLDLSGVDATAGVDAAGLDGAQHIGHLRGSRPGDCSFATASQPETMGAFLVAVFLALGTALRRRRA